MEQEGMSEAASPESPPPLQRVHESALVEPDSIDFLDQVAEMAGVNRARALEATGVVLCTLLSGTDEEVSRDLQVRLPSALGQVLSQCPQLRGNSVPISGPTTLVHAVSRRMQISEMEAQAYTFGVLEVTERVAGGDLARGLKGFEPE